MQYKLVLFLVSVFALQSCYKTQGPEYLDELDVTVTAYDKDFDFNSTKTVIVNDTVALKHDYLSDSQIKDFYKKGGGSDKIVEGIIAQFKAKGFTVKSTHPLDASFLKNVDLFVNPVLTMSKTTSTVYYPGYGWGGYYPGWGWGWGYSSYYKSAPNNLSPVSLGADSKLIERSSDYYYYPGWGGYYPTYGYSYEYKTGFLTIEMGEGDSVRAYWDWFINHTPEEIEDNPNDVPQIKLVWTAFIEGLVSSDVTYNNDRAKRGLDEAFEQAYYLDK